MEKKLEIKPFDLKIDDSLLIQNFSLAFFERQSICLLGESGCGKTILLKTLKNVSPSSITFYLGEELEQEVDESRLDSETKVFVQEFLKNKGYLEKKQALLSKILEQPQFLFCDDLHTFLTHREFSLLFSYLSSHDICFFYVTNSIEDTYLFDYMMVVKNHQIAIEGKPSSVLKEEKIMKLLGYQLPFYPNLSIQLGYYDVLDCICLSKEELESALWKSN